MFSTFGHGHTGTQFQDPLSAWRADRLYTGALPQAPSLYSDTLCVTYIGVASLVGIYIYVYIYYRMFVVWLIWGCIAFIWNWGLQ